ncbi:MAG: O-antigen ligase family protein [Firmicutes bacterium]|nr:O-antigen ligase family protein [Bacillota bacterium]
MGWEEQEISSLQREIVSNDESGDEGASCVRSVPWQERIERVALYAGAVGLGLGHGVIPQVILLVIGIHRFIVDPRSRKAKFGSITTILQVLTVWMMLSAIPAIRPFSALGGAIGMALSGWVTLGAVYGIMMNDENLGANLVRVFLGSSCVGAIHAVTNYILAWSKGRGYYRAALPFIGCNAAGTVFCVAILIALGCFRSADRRGKLMMVPVILLLTSALMVTQSRGAFVAFVVGFIVFLLLGAGSRHSLVLKVVALVSLVLVVAFVFKISPSVAKRYARILNPMANKDRLEIWRTALLMIRDHPVLGVGLNNFVNFYPLYEHPEGFGTSMYMAHNVFLEFGATTGIPGLILFVVIAVLGISGGIRGLIKAGSSSSLPATTLAIFAAILTHLQFDITLNSGDMLPFFFVPYGVLILLEQWLESRNHPRPSL